MGFLSQVKGEWYGLPTKYPLYHILSYVFLLWLCSSFSSVLCLDLSTRIVDLILAGFALIIACVILISVGQDDKRPSASALIGTVPYMHAVLATSAIRWKKQAVEERKTQNQIGLYLKIQISCSQHRY